MQEELRARRTNTGRAAVNAVPEDDARRLRRADTSSWSRSTGRRQPFWAPSIAWNPTRGAVDARPRPSPSCLSDSVAE